MESDERSRLEARVGQCEEELRLSPDNTDLLYECAHVMHSLGRYLDAAHRFESILRLEPDDHEVLHALACALHQLGRFDEAVSKFARAIELWPDEPAFYADMGDALRALGRFEEARMAYETGLPLVLPHEEAQYQILQGLDSLPLPTD